jgi:hypothetical protein
MLAHDRLENRRRAQAREGLPPEASLSTEDYDDDDKGMEATWASAPKPNFGSHWTRRAPSVVQTYPRRG